MDSNVPDIFSRVVEISTQLSGKCMLHDHESHRDYMRTRFFFFTCKILYTSVGELSYAKHFTARTASQETGIIFGYAANSFVAKMYEMNQVKS